MDDMTSLSVSQLRQKYSEALTEARVPLAEVGRQALPGRALGGAGHKLFLGFSLNAKRYGVMLINIISVTLLTEP